MSGQIVRPVAADAAPPFFAQRLRQEANDALAIGGRPIGDFLRPQWQQPLQQRVAPCIVTAGRRDRLFGGSVLHAREHRSSPADGDNYLSAIWFTRVARIEKSARNLSPPFMLGLALLYAGAIGALAFPQLQSAMCE